MYFARLFLIFTKLELSFRNSRLFLSQTIPTFSRLFRIWPKMTSFRDYSSYSFHCIFETIPYFKIRDSLDPSKWVPNCKNYLKFGTHLPPPPLVLVYHLERDKFWLGCFQGVYGQTPNSMGMASSQSQPAINPEQGIRALSSQSNYCIRG